MIKSLDVKGFTVLPDGRFQFARGVNVVIGSNGTGKSHLLKLAYTAARWSREMSEREKGQGRPDKATLQKELGGKLVRVFRPEGLGRLSTRGQGVHRTEVGIAFHESAGAGFRFSFSTKSTTDATLDKPPSAFFDGESVFFPTKEMLSMFPGFTALYRKVEIQIDETYFDLCLALEMPLSRGRKLAEVKPLLDQAEAVLGGPITIENGRFYLSQEGKGKFEISLIAEGFRKFGALAHLLANGTLARQSILFWDEPETNLNPAYMRKVAEILVAIARNGTQVVAATHSLFIMRELSLQLGLDANHGVERRFFALGATDGRAAVHAGDSAESIEPIDALDVEIDQSQRFLDAQSTAGPR